MSAAISIFPGAEEVPITREEFADYTERRFALPAILGRLKLRASIPTFHTIGPSSQGTVHHMNRDSPREKKDMAVVTSAEFPEWLRVSAAMDRHTALEVAAVYVEGYKLIVGGMRQRPPDVPRLRRCTGSLEPQLWPANYDRGVIALPYRAAAWLALNSIEMDRLEVPQVSNEPHIASLGNPLSEIELAQLSKGLQ